MNEQNESNLWAAVCVKLLQGPVYDDDNGDKTTWKNLLLYQSQVAAFFAPIGLSLCLDTAEGYAFLKQDEDENGDTAGGIPRLIRKYPLSFEMSLLCVILREALEHFDTSQSESAMLVMSEHEIKELLSVYLKEKTDQTRLYRELDSYLSKAVELSFLREIGPGNTEKQERSFEVRRIIRAKIDMKFLEDFKAKLAETYPEDKSAE